MTPPVYTIPSWAIVLSLQPRTRWRPWATALAILRANLGARGRNND